MHLDETVKQDHKLRYYLNIVVGYAKKEMQRLSITEFDHERKHDQEEENEKPLTYSKIVGLNKSLYKAIRTYHKVE